MTVEPAGIQGMDAGEVARRHRQLRSGCEELAAMATFGEMLRQARDSSLRDDLFHSSGERIFSSMLEDTLVRPMGTGVGETLYRQLSATLPPPPAAAALDTRA